MKLHVVTFKDEQIHAWVAGCLEYAFFGQSETQQGAVENILAAMELEQKLAAEEGREPFVDLPKPDHAFLEWAATTGPRRRLQVEL